MKKDQKNTKKTALKFEKILGIKVLSTDKGEVLTAIEKKVSHNSKFYIVTPNPELVLMSQEDKALKNALNGTDFAVPDGIGLSMAARFYSFKAHDIVSTFFQGFFVGVMAIINKKYLTDYLEVIKGRELFWDLMGLADKNKWRVYFLGGEHDEAKVAAEKISKKYKKITIKSNPGPMFDNNGSPATEIDRKMYLDAVEEINKFRPHLLIVCLQDPKEEKFVAQNYKVLNIVGAAALGGTFRFVAGYSRLAPAWVSGIGLEWLFRLITEPYRLRRIINAWPIFPIKVWMSKLTTKRS